MGCIQEVSGGFSGTFKSVSQAFLKGFQAVSEVLQGLSGVSGAFLAFTTYQGASEAFQRCSGDQEISGGGS